MSYVGGLYYQIFMQMREEKIQARYRCTLLGRVDYGAGGWMEAPKPNLEGGGAIPIKLAEGGHGPTLNPIGPCVCKNPSP